MPWFDAHAAGYDDWWGTPLGRYVDGTEKAVIGAVAQPLPGERGLDLGCGTGQHTVWLAEQGLTVTGLDESPAMLAVAARKAERRGSAVTWMLGDAATPPLQKGSFDLVVSVAALEFVPDPREVLRAAYDVLRPGGRLVAGLLTRDSAWGELYRQAAADPGNVFARAHLFTEGEVRALSPVPPSVVRRALYHPPAPDFDEAAAARLEAQLQREQGPGAGFLAVRWDKEL